MRRLETALSAYRVKQINKCAKQAKLLVDTYATNPTKGTRSDLNYILDCIKESHTRYER